MEKVSKIWILCIMLFMSIGTISAQTDRRENTQKTEEDESADLMELPDEAPTFPGGIEGLMNFLNTHVRYPEKAVKDSIEGRVLVRFIIERDGSVSNIEIVERAHPVLDVEAIRVIGDMPKWGPAKKDGKPLRIRFSLPITFRLPRE